MQNEKPLHSGGYMKQPGKAEKFIIAFMLAAFGVLTLTPKPAYAWWNGDWTARKQITIDTSSTGAAITDPVGAMPVLVRLDVSNFTFDAANPDGSDLRFVAADDKTPLTYHIEKYDHLLGQAFIWVSVPDVKPSGQTNFFMYYGNKKASAADNAKGTYDANMMAVYHFGEHDAPPKDWTANNNNALNKGQPDDFALVGPGERLDGQTPLQLPGSPSLAWNQNQALTWSVWLNETTLQPGAVLYSRTDGTNSVQIGVDNGVPFIAVTGASGTQRSNGGTPITPASWHYLAVVAANGSLTLYVDGNLYATLAAGLPALNSIAYLGGDATTGTAPGGGTATTGFIGSIDELEISNISRPLGFLKFEAIGQGNNPLAGRLLNFGTEQKPSSWFSGNLAIILGSVTVDGWVIIGLLALMAIISWVVMADKAAYIGRVDKANHRFMDRYRQQWRNISEPEKGGKKTSLTDSPLYNIYQVGFAEVEKRIDPAQREQLLSAQSISAIRSSLDSVVVRQIQKLNSSMVLLTIAISGGPFLGLLGTVVGVMITFASIAAAGNVNVNAIAPGISAALAATVAGLIVAIPALFGYNYLNSRISNGVSDMRVFVDEFETRIAEIYSPAVIAAPGAGD
jgi:biopolymer transport protein ExbB